MNVSQAIESGVVAGAPAELVATILDVAREARVSVGTVSRVLSRNSTVSQERQRRVLQAIKALRYIPRQRKVSMAELNPLAGKNVLLLMLGMRRSLEILPVVASAVHGVEHAIKQSKAKLLFADVPTIDHVPEVLREERVDAVILKGALQGDLIGATTPELIRRLHDLPTVWILGRPNGGWGDVVQVNDMLVGQIAAEHLIAHGHRNLAFVSPKPSQVTLMRRQASFTFYAQSAGATVRAYLGPHMKWGFPSPPVDDVVQVQELIDRLLAEPERPTAIFAPDDSVGAMVARGLAARDLQAGRDISLMSCNNDRMLLLGVHPALTTIDVHPDEIGQRAVDQLAWRLTHRDKVAVDIGVEPTLVPGRSVMTDLNCGAAHRNDSATPSPR